MAREGAGDPRKETGPWLAIAASVVLIASTFLDIGAGLGRLWSIRWEFPVLGFILPAMVLVWVAYPLVSGGVEPKTRAGFFIGAGVAYVDVFVILASVLGPLASSVWLASGFVSGALLILAGAVARSTQER